MPVENENGENRGGLTPGQLDLLLAAARERAGRIPRPLPDHGIHWRLLGYIAIGGSILILLTVELFG